MQQLQQQKVLYVSGLSPDTRDQDLTNFFNQFAPVTKSVVIFDKKTKLSNRCGYVFFETEEDAVMAKDAQGQLLKGCPIKVEFSRTQQLHTPTPGYYLGRSTNRGSGHNRGRGRGFDASRASHLSKNKILIQEIINKLKTDPCPKKLDLCLSEHSFFLAVF